MGLKDFLRSEKEKTASDVQWALHQSPETANKTMKFLRSSIAVKLAVLMAIGGGLYLAVTTLTTVKLGILLYILVGSGVARYSDYSWTDWESYTAVLLWLPIVFYSFLPDSVRIEK